MIRAVLFDLDGTLLDTSSIKRYREAKNWRQCIRCASQTSLFNGIPDLLKGLNDRGIKTAIVTTSVSFYAQGLCRHHNVLCNELIAFHDAKPKPAPDSFLLALRKLDVPACDAIGVGDDTPDSVALFAAKVKSFGAGWNPAINPDAKWDRLLLEPLELLNILDE